MLMKYITQINNILENQMMFFSLLKAEDRFMDSYRNSLAQL